MKSDTPDITVFFRDDSKWRSPSPTESIKKSESYEIISNEDREKLEKIKTCLMQLREIARKEKRERTIKGVLKVFDNYALSLFIEELALILDDIQSHKSIKDYVGRGKATFTIEVDIEE